MNALYTKKSPLFDSGDQNQPYENYTLTKNSLETSSIRAVRAMHVMAVHMPVVHTVRLHTTMMHGHPLVSIAPIATIITPISSSIALPVLSPVIVPVPAILSFC